MPCIGFAKRQIAAMAVNEFLARIHPYRSGKNRDHAWRTVVLTDVVTLSEPDGKPCPVMAANVGRGDLEPLLEITELG